MRRALHAGADFSQPDFPFIFAATAFGTCQIHDPAIQPGKFCETVVKRARQSAPCVPTDDNLLTHLAELKQFDLGAVLETVGLWAALHDGPRACPPHARSTATSSMVQGYGLTETGF